MFIGMPLSSESLHWLYSKNKKERAFANLAKIYSVDTNDLKLKEVISEIEEVMDSNQEVKQSKWRVVIVNGV